MGVDLIKAYEKLDWEFMYLVSIKSGLSFINTKWIMVCIRTSNFAVLVNGWPTHLFQDFKGLR